MTAEVDATRWGRVDDDGTVYVRTGDGERPVGSYPGASPEEALGYFARKYAELEGQVALLEQRCENPEVPLKDLQGTHDRLRAALTDAHVVGDLAALDARLAAVRGRLDARRAEADAERAQARERARAEKERVVSEAESLATATGAVDYKRGGDRLRALLEEWKALPRLERPADDALWQRFRTARSAFDKRRRSHFAELEAQRGEAQQRKERLVEQAEALSASTDWGPTAARYRELMAQWKGAGRARRDVDDTLWKRFRAAQDAFFTARSATFAERDKEQRANLEAKTALLAEAEALLPVADPRSTRAALRTIHERWDRVGHVPRAERDRLEARLKAVEDAVRGAEPHTAASSPAADLARQTVAQLHDVIARLEAERLSARAAGDARAEQAAEQALAARREWLAGAERTLRDLGGRPQREAPGQDGTDGTDVTR